MHDSVKSLRRAAIAGGSAVGLALLLFGCMGFGLPLDLVLNLALGWILFLDRIPDARVEPDVIVTALVCLVLLSVGLHRFLGWIHGQMQAQGAREGEGDAVARRWKRSWTASALAIVLLMFVSGLASVGIAHQAGWLLTSGEPFVSSGMSAARRSQSVHNLKTVGRALAHYHETMSSFPPGGMFDGQGRAFHGWQATILPDLEEQALYNQVNFDLPWDDPRNSTAFRTVVNAFINPEIRVQTDEAGFALSHYAGNALVLGGDVPRTLNEINDGPGVTIMAGEVAVGFKPWGSPTNWRDPARGINRTPDGFGSPFPRGANILFADGSVRFIKTTVDLRVMKALATPNGGEPISPDSY